MDTLYRYRTVDDVEQWMILQLKLIPTIEILTERFVKLKQKLKNVDLDLFCF